MTVEYPDLADYLAVVSAITGAEPAVVLASRFEEFRRDPEDMGAWTPVADNSTRQFKTEAGAASAARDAVSWLPSVLDERV